MLGPKDIKETHEHVKEQMKKDETETTRQDKPAEGQKAPANPPKTLGKEKKD